MQRLARFAQAHTRLIWRLWPLCLAGGLLLTAPACRADTQLAETPQAELVDYGHGRAPWVRKLQDLARGRPVKFRVLQLGDSHTAGDYFTQALRERWQQVWGDGGLGWVYPQKIAGQRNAQVRHQSSGWQPFSSRKDRIDFPIGGIISRSGPDGSLTVEARSPQAGRQHITLTARAVFADQALGVYDAQGRAVAALQPGDSGQWGQHRFEAELPVSIRNQGGDLWELGHINIENSRPGVVVSAMGINGAQLAHWQNWRSDWWRDLAATEADWVILAYGTNEAFNPQLDLAHTETVWRETIRRIRQSLPRAGIVIIGAPESLSRTGGACGTRPAGLDGVQALQQRLAQEEQTLYWSWQAAMGGRCSMKSWMAQQRAARDGVHFSAEGYRLAGGQLAEALIRRMQAH